MRRINVIGTTGSGKTTFAARLADIMGTEHIELDAIHWQPGWTPIDPDEFRRIVAEKVAAESWVVDGQYSQVVRPLVWERADTVVWLNFSFPVMFWRLIRRTARRVVTRKPMWNDNRESLRDVFSRDSILWWQLKTFRSKRRRYPEELADPQWSPLEVVVLTSPREAARWLESMEGAGRE